MYSNNSHYGPTMELKTKADLILLHFHCCHDHMSMVDIQALSLKGYLPCHIAHCKIPLCAAFQLGKAKMKAAGKSKLIPADKVEPGDLIHMDQVESTTPGRPLTYSGKNNSNKSFFVTVFVDSVSKKIFTEFQHSCSAAETLKSKHNIEREAHQHSVKIKLFR